jgi:hypothetical protein
VARRLHDLRALDDAALIAEHDQLAEHTLVGTDYYMSELDRRSRERATTAAQELARRAYWLTVTNTILASVAVIAAIVALLTGD